MVCYPAFTTLTMLVFLIFRNGAMTAINVVRIAAEITTASDNLFFISPLSYLRDKQSHHKYLLAALPYTHYANSHLKKAPSGFDPKYPHPLLSLPHTNHITHSSLPSKIAHLLITACFFRQQITNRFLHLYRSLQTLAASQGYHPALYGSLSA